MKYLIAALVVMITTIAILATAVVQAQTTTRIPDVPPGAVINDPVCVWHEFEWEEEFVAGFSGGTWLYQDRELTTLDPGGSLVTFEAAPGLLGVHSRIFIDVFTIDDQASLIQSGATNTSLFNYCFVDDDSPLKLIAMQLEDDNTFPFKDFLNLQAPVP